MVEKQKPSFRHGAHDLFKSSGPDKGLLCHGCVQVWKFFLKVVTTVFDFAFWVFVVFHMQAIYNFSHFFEASISHRCKRNFHNLSQWKEKEKMFWVEKDHPTRLCTDTVDGIYFIYVISPNLRFCGNFLYLAIDEAFRIHISFFFIISDGDGKLLLVMMIVLARTICMKYSGSMQLNIE